MSSSDVTYSYFQKILYEYIIFLNLNIKIDMQRAKLPAHCLCPFHPFDVIQKITIDSHATKHLYCNQCIIEEEVPTSQSHLLSIEEFLNLAAQSYSEAREKAQTTPDPPIEYLNVLSKKAENLDKLTKHINRQKDHIEQAFTICINLY